MRYNLVNLEIQIIKKTCIFQTIQIIISLIIYKLNSHIYFYTLTHYVSISIWFQP
jgi:hypothetical protein